MRTTGPAIIIAEKRLKISDAGYARNQPCSTVAISRLDPLRECRRCSVMPDDFRRAPFAPLQISDPAAERLLRVFSVDGGPHYATTSLTSKNELRTPPYFLAEDTPLNVVVVATGAPALILRVVLEVVPASIDQSSERLIVASASIEYCCAAASAFAVASWNRATINVFAEPSCDPRHADFTSRMFAAEFGVKPYGVALCVLEALAERFQPVELHLWRFDERAQAMRVTRK